MTGTNKDTERKIGGVGRPDTEVRFRLWISLVVSFLCFPPLFVIAFSAADLLDLLDYPIALGLVPAVSLGPMLAGFWLAIGFKRKIRARLASGDMDGAREAAVWADRIFRPAYVAVLWGIALYLVFALPAFDGYRRRQNDHAAQEVVWSLVDAQEAYRTKHGRYAGPDEKTVFEGLEIKRGIEVTILTGGDSWSARARHRRGRKVYRYDSREGRLVEEPGDPKSSPAPPQTPPASEH